MPVLNNNQRACWYDDSEQRCTRYIHGKVANHTPNIQALFLQVYDISTQQLTRLLTVPLGAEATGTYYIPNVNGYSYIMNQVQHPGVTTGFGNRGAIGYVLIDETKSTCAVPGGEL